MPFIIYLYILHKKIIKFTIIKFCKLQKGTCYNTEGKI